MANHLFDALFGPHAQSNEQFLLLGDRPAMTHRAFAGLMARYAGAMRAHGVTRGDRVAVQVAKSPQALAVYGACIKCGAVLLPLNTAYTPDEIAYFVGDAEPALLLCDEAAESRLAPMAADAGATAMTLNSDGSGSFADAAAAAEPFETPAAAEAGDLAAILYTSGTTGRAKGAMLSHENLLSNAQVLRELWRFDAEDTLVHALPIFHTHGLFVAVNIALLAGARMHFLPKFDVDAIIGAIPAATAMMGVPTFYTRLLDDPRLTRELTTNMRLFISGSAPLLAETHERFEARTGHRILERYGMTETNMNTSNPYDGERRAGTVGLPLPGTEIRITDPQSGRELADGETGMIEVRGPNVFKGYWRMPEKTAEEKRENGFFITGDLGMIDPDGYLRIVGRQKDLIISGGYNIYPKEIEATLDDLPGVLESAVIAAPHADLGEGVVGVIVGEPGVQIDPEEIVGLLSGKLARFKQPRRIFVVDALPRNTMGKVQKNMLRQQYADCLQQSR